MSAAFQSGAFQSDGFQSEAPLEGSIGPYAITPVQLPAPRVHRSLRPVGFNALNIGGLWVFNRPENAFSVEAFSFLSHDTGQSSADGHIYPAGLPSDVFGAASVRNNAALVFLQGISSQLNLGKPAIINKSHGIFAQGFTTQVVSAPRIYNFDQYLYPWGIGQQGFGIPFLTGGVKFVNPAGMPAPAFPNPVVVNTTENRSLGPLGVAPPAMAVPSVSPRILYPAGAALGLMGTPLVQFPPRPVGWVSQRFGVPSIDYKTKLVSPAGMALVEPVGYPKVRDRAQRLLVAPIVNSGIFGDIKTSLVRQFMRPRGFDGFTTSQWTEVRSNRRQYEARGWSSASVGLANIWNKWPNLTPKAWNSATFGRTDIGLNKRRIGVPGISAPVSALPTPVLTQTPSFTPTGWVATVVPALVIWHRVRKLEGVGGFDAQRLGYGEVGYRQRKLDLQGQGIELPGLGVARVEHELRVIEPPQIYPPVGGEPWVSYGQRTLAPRGIEYPLLPRHRVGGTQYVGAQGFEATRWLRRIVPESQGLEPERIKAPEVPWPTVELRKRFVLAMGIRWYEGQMRWGVATLHNSRQYIALKEDAQDGLHPPTWSGWTRIENRNRTVGGIGLVATRYGRPSLELKARVLAPASVSAPALPEYQKTGSVTHYVRPLPVPGIEPPYMTGWAVVWNKAKVLAPKGIAEPALGRAALVNTRRGFKFQGFATDGYGYPLVAFRIRGLSFEQRYSIEPPFFPLPSVFLGSRYIQPTGIDGAVRGQSKLGLPILATHFNRITTRWTHRDLLGQPEIRNMTPEVRARGGVSDVYGSALVRLQWRPVRVEGSTMSLFGRALIEDRAKKVRPTGMQSLHFGDIVVTKYGADPVVTQYIDLRRMLKTPDGIEYEADEGYGIAPPTFQVGLPDLMKGYIYLDKYPSNGIAPPEVGKPTVRANTIRVEPGYNEQLMGEPFVSLLHRVLAPTSLGPLIENGVDNQTMGSFGKPRLSPHTIYAVSEAPLQAWRNHGGPMPGANVYVNAGVRFGTPAISLQQGNVLYPRGIAYVNSELMGFPSLHNKIQQVEPFGWNALRMGWLSIPSEQTIAIEDAIAAPELPWPTVSRPPYIGPQQVLAGGHGMTEFGANRVELLNRTVEVSGITSLGMGYSRGVAEERMPQSLHVGPPLPTLVEGFDAGQHGSPWVSHRVREVLVEGYDAFISEYDYTKFDQRMRVIRVSKPISRQQIGTHGFQSSALGTPNVRPGVYYIRPDGNTMNFRQGASNAN